MRQMARLGFAMAAALALASCGGKHLTPAPSWLNLSGTWRFNATETAALAGVESAQRPAARAVPMEPGAEGGAPQPAGGGGGRGGGRGGAGGGRGGMTGGGNTGVAPRPTAPRRATSLGRPLEQVTIEQREGEVAFRFAPNDGVNVPTTWTKTETTVWPDAPEAQLKARWGEQALEVERKIGSATVKEEYSRARGSDRMLVTIDLGNGRKVTRVYDLVPPTQP